MKYDALPPGVAPIGFARPAAAQYVGVSVGLFDQMVSDGRMPQPRHANTRLLWDRRELTAKFQELPQNDDIEENEWNEVLEGTV